MKKRDALFCLMTALSAGILAILIAENIVVILSARSTETRAALASAISPTATQQEPDPQRTAEIQRRFYDMGLTPHAGRYWKKVE